MRHGLVPDRDCSIGDKRKLLPIGSDACFLERLSYGVELIVGSGNNILILIGCQLLRASLQSDLQQPILVNARSRDGDLAFPVEHVRDAPARCEVPLFWVKILRISAPVRFLLSVAVSTMIATPPGA